MLVQYLVATACLLFVLSLPLGKLPVATTLRRWAAVLFLLAFAPSVFFGLIQSSTPHASPGSPSEGCSLGAIAGFVILSLLAYGILELRKRLRPGKSGDAWSDYVSLRTSGKKPVAPTGGAVHRAPGLFDDPDAES